MRTSSSTTHRPMVSALIAALAAALLIGGCSSTKNLALDSTFPVPLIPKVPLSLGIFLDNDLRSYTYNEKIENKGEWNVGLGAVQEPLFVNLAQGLLDGHELVSSPTTPTMDGVLKPHIDELQFSLPEQTRSNFYEVWIRYRFELYDPEGGLVGEWKLPAYGKASKKDFGSSSSGVEAAAIAACRDAMAFFALNFTREPVVKQWLDAGKPPGTAVVTSAQSAAGSTPTGSTSTQPGAGTNGGASADENKADENKADEKTAEKEKAAEESSSKTDSESGDGAEENADGSEGNEDAEETTTA